jgi:hypothetical protein
MILEKKNTIFVTSLIVILIISIFSVRELLSNESPQSEEYTALAEQLLNEAHEEFAKIRGVSLRQVDLVVVNRDWVIENWGKGYADPEIADIIREEKIYKALFMISQNASLYDARIEWTGLYRVAKWQGRIYVVEENFDLTDEFKAKSSLVHELTHILQEDYSITARPKTFDGDKAIKSLTEGDATFMADTFRGEGVYPSISSIIPDEKILSIPLQLMFSGEIQPSLPSTINDLNRFPYLYGAKFVEVLYERGGWEAVDEAYENPPNTTEQVMHPEKYFAQEDAHIVEAPTIIVDWNLKKTERFGEYFILVKLNNWIPIKEAEEAAEGWGGDNLTYYERDDEYLITWNISWDSTDDANEFYIAFQRMMNETSAEQKNSSHWFANGRYISIQCNENSTLIMSSTNETIVQQPYFE